MTSWRPIIKPLYSSKTIITTFIVVKSTAEEIDRKAKQAGISKSDLVETLINEVEPDPVTRPEPVIVSFNLSKECVAKLDERRAGMTRGNFLEHLVRVQFQNTLVESIQQAENGELSPIDLAVGRAIPKFRHDQPG
jgi:hypothetical protein